MTIIRAPAGSAQPSPSWRAASTSEINAAAAVTPINLVAMAILATPRQALPERELHSQVELYQRLLRDAPYSPLVTVTRDSGEQMIRYAETMGMLQRQKHPLGDIMRMNAENAVLATYYRNNILHLFAHALAAGVRFRRAMRACAPPTSSAWSGASIPTFRPSCTCAGTKRR